MVKPTNDITKGGKQRDARSGMLSASGKGGAQGGPGKGPQQGAAGKPKNDVLQTGKPHNNSYSKPPRRPQGR